MLVDLGSSERLRLYVEGGYVRWQIGQYLVDRICPADQASASEQRAGTD